MRQSALRALGNLKHRDFFGIYDITNKDIAGAFATKTKLPLEEIDKKYDPLLKSRNRLSNEEKSEDIVFGRVRYDADNVTKKHGQFEDGSMDKLYDTIQVKQMFVSDNEIESRDCDKIESKDQPTNPEKDTWGIPFKISEVQPAREMAEILQMFKSLDDDKRRTTVYKNKPPVTFYFGGVISTDSPEEPPSQQKSISNISTKNKDDEGEMKLDLRRPQVDLDAQAGPRGAQAPLHELDITSEEYQERQDEQTDDRFDRSLDKRFDVDEQASQAKPMKALEYLSKVRTRQIEPTTKKLKERLAETERPYTFAPVIKLDSKGYRIYTDQVPDWHSARRVDILGYLRNSIIYHNYDILAINKPYGISSHVSPNDKDGLDLNSLMRDVAKSLRINDIYLAHRLDKTTTGILLFATSKARAQNLNKLFKADEIKKTYWCITRGVPNPPEGLIDLPIGEFEVTGKLRSCPAPIYLNEDKHLAKNFREARRAVTEYRVIDEKRHVALVELKPQSGVKHQLRCHMGFGLNTPILGDHKYSHVVKLAPQKLAPSVLKALHIRQSKVRTLPIHLHAKSVVIPGAKANGETLFIHSPLPRHFIDNLKSLKLSYSETLAS